ncbi:MAG: tetratricopeptide repeat protein [Myxococcota bacterium]|nr:tetratricopeptide repeat protein [Myxococcota bacterium]
MADPDVSKPAEPPKPVHIGGESIADRILPHLKKIVIGVIVLAVILSIFFGFRSYQQSKQAAETEKLAKVLSLAQRPVAAPGAPEDKNTPTFADPKARATALLDELAKQGTSSLGAAFRGGLLLDAGKVDDAIAEYRKGTTAAGIEGLAAREGLGIALETKAVAEQDPAAKQKLLEEALAAFVAMQPDDAGPRRGYALYHQARLHEVMGKPSEAKALYERAQEKAAASAELSALVEKRLAGLGAS